MFALARLLVIGFAVLTIVYVSLLFFVQAQRRAALGSEWDRNPSDLSRADYISKGLEANAPMVRRRLIVAVYVMPTIVMGIIITLTNVT